MAFAMGEVSKVCLAGEQQPVRVQPQSAPRQLLPKGRSRRCFTPLRAAGNPNVAAAAATAKPPAAAKKAIDQAYPGINPEKAEDLYRLLPNIT